MPAIPRCDYALPTQVIPSAGGGIEVHPEGGAQREGAAQPEARNRHYALAGAQQHHTDARLVRNR